MVRALFSSFTLTSMQLWKSPTWSTDKPPDVRHEDMSRMQLHRMLVIVTTCRNLFQHAQLTASQLGRQRKMKVLAEQQRTGFNCFITKPFDVQGFIEVVRDLESFWMGIVALPRTGD